MYYPEPGAPPHRGYMFREQAVQIARTGCQTGLVYVEQRLLKDLNWKTFRQENHFQVTEEESEHVVILRMHAWNPKLSTRIGAIIWSLLTLLTVGIYIRRHGKPDLIHAHFGTWAGYAAWLAFKCYGIPYVGHRTCLVHQRRKGDTGPGSYLAYGLQRCPACHLRGDTTEAEPYALSGPSG